MVNSICGLKTPVDEAGMPVSLNQNRSKNSNHQWQAVWIIAAQKHRFPTEIQPWTLQLETEEVLVCECVWQWERAKVTHYTFL